MNEQEILNHFNSKKESTCGFFLESQLKTYSNKNPLPSKQKSNRLVSSVFGFSLFSILSLHNCYSQEKKENETERVKIGYKKAFLATQLLAFSG
ncbi:MAG: hypothetical protein EOP45_22600 [Sphingobacteriaceae bacterium]|nr:MAG: hypothetical protein EOP45_22600 [Sphingobacteriaceae bacterium]